MIYGNYGNNDAYRCKTCAEVCSESSNDIDDDDNDINVAPSNKTPQLDDPMFPAC